MTAKSAGPGLMIKGSGVDSSYVAIGKISKAQGLEGEVKVIAFSGDPKEFASYQEIFLARGHERRVCTIEKCRCHGKFAIVALQEVTDRNASEALVGSEVFVLKSQMPALTSDEFYWHEMVGLTVVTDQGQDLGKVTSLIATGGYDVLVVAGGDQEYLIPVTQDIIVRQDREAGILVVAPPDGLLEMNSPDAM